MVDDQHSKKDKQPGSSRSADGRAPMSPGAIKERFRAGLKDIKQGVASRLPKFDKPPSQDRAKQYPTKQAKTIQRQANDSPNPIEDDGYPISTPAPIIDPAPNTPADRAPEASAPVNSAPPKRRNISGAIARFLKRIVKPVLLTGATVALTAIIPALYFLFVMMAPRVPDGTDLWNINRQSSIVILDRDSKEMMSRGARYGEAIAVGELPDYLVQAFLATEDRRFYEHFGVDVRGTIRAALTNHRSGRVVQGGSTITQQLAKNLFLKPDRTYKRKIHEALLALWLEGRYSKDELLSLYINRIYLGAGAYGVEQAAQTYFNKSARDVTLSEAAMLAGLPKAPSSLAPTNNLEAAKKRSAEVLKNLIEINAITPYDAHVANLKTPTLAPDISADLGYVFDYVSAKARALVGDYSGDLIISTTLDAKLQAGAEAALRSHLTSEIINAKAEQAALISYNIDGSTLAMVGGINYRESQFNRVSQAKRQPGSAFKPFVYLAALEEGIKPNAKFIDQPINIDGWEPKNYANTYAGPVPLTQAMARSINTVSVQLSEKIGREKVIEVARKLGIKSPLNVHPSIALGATDITLEELTSAYLPMARTGTKVTPYIITDIKDHNGNSLYQHPSIPAVRVFSEKTGEDLNHLLYQVMYSGTGRRAALSRRQTVGKTGTTNDWRDAWFLGYSAQIVTGVWVGNDRSEGMDKITGGSVPAQIWKTYMQVAHQGLPAEKLAGAYPALTITNEPVLLDFYRDVENGFSRIARERRKSNRQLSRDARRDNGRNDNQSTTKKKRRRGFFGLGRRKRDN